MSNRPSSWYYNTTLYWTIYTYDSSGSLVDADFTPTVDTFIDGASYATVSVTVTKRPSTTGIYDCSFAGLPTANSYGTWQFEEEVTLSGTAYVNGWSCQQVDNSAQQITDAVLDEPVLNHQLSASVGWKIQDTNQRTASTLTIVAGLNDFDPATDTVANVTTVQTCVSNSDMRGTDGANTVVPDNAGISSNGSAIAALNDFDPATQAVTTANAADVTAIKVVTDKVDTALVQDGAVYQYTVNALENAPSGGGGSATLANQQQILADIAALNDFDPATDTVVSVTNVAVCATNTDMRGTDSANTIAPDNAGITANGVAIAALNDTTPQQFWDALTSGTYATGSFGESILISQTGQRDLLVTSHHVAADVHTFQPNAIDAQAIDAGAVTKMQAGLATTSDLATVTKTGVQYTATAQSGDTILVTLS